MSKGRESLLRRGIDMAEKCAECSGRGSYYTEWSDSAEASPYLKSLVVDYPLHPDGTVLIKCVHCNAYQEADSGC